MRNAIKGTADISMDMLLNYSNLTENPQSPHEAGKKEGRERRATKLQNKVGGRRKQPGLSPTAIKRQTGFFVFSRLYAPGLPFLEHLLRSKTSNYNFFSDPLTRKPFYTQLRLSQGPGTHPSETRSSKEAVAPSPPPGLGTGPGAELPHGRRRPRAA